MASQPNPPPKWRPPPMRDSQLDLSLHVAYDNIYGLQESAVGGVERGLRLAHGIEKVTGVKKSVATGLSTVKNVTASIDGGSTGFFEIASVTPSIDAGHIDLFTWQTGGVPSVTPRQVRWVAVGS